MSTIGFVERDVSPCTFFKQAVETAPPRLVARVLGTRLPRHRRRRGHRRHGAPLRLQDRQRSRRRVRGDRLQSSRGYPSTFAPTSSESGPGKPEWTLFGDIHGIMQQYKTVSTYQDSPFYRLVRHFMLEQMHQWVILSDGIVHFIGQYIFALEPRGTYYPGCTIIQNYIDANM